MGTNTTTADALRLAEAALRAGHVLQVDAYAGVGTLTAGPSKTATGAGMQWVVYAYFPAGRGNFSRECDLRDACRILLEYCGRGKLGRAARGRLGEDYILSAEPRRRTATARTRR